MSAHLLSGHPVSTPAAAPRRRSQSALVALLTALVLALSSLGAAGPAAGQEATSRVLVTAASSVADAVAAVVEAGGTIVGRYDTFGIVVADVRETETLTSDARVAAVAADAALAPQSEDPDTTTAELPPPSYTAGQTIGADALHALGYDGTGVGVAVIDTGVANNPLVHGQVLATVDTSTTPNYRDGHGHGTFMAGLIAGQPEGSYGPFSGIAPGAHLVDIKVANSNGRATVSGMIAGLAAAQKAQRDLGVRVVLLAAGADPADAGPAGEALERSLEQLWRGGLIVVVPSGNNSGYVSTPGVSPYLVTVGAINDKNTASTSDDVLWGNSGGGAVVPGAKPDLVAPGVSLVSTRAPSSMADAVNPRSRIGGHLFRGTGTSMAAAVTAGAAALLVDAADARGLTSSPDAIKTQLVLSARDGVGRIAGTVDLVGALITPSEPSVNGQLAEIPYIPLTNDVDDAVVLPGGRSWVGRSWVDDDWKGRSWVDGTWDGRSWVDDAWVGRSWVSHSWIGRSWVDSSWSGRSWVNHAWDGRSWVNHAWDGRSWVNTTWDGRSWVGFTWVSYSWLSTSWV